MLILSRVMGERIVIFTNPPVIVTLSKIRHDGVRIGFDAHHSVKISREEHLTPEQIETVEAACGLKRPGTKDQAGESTSQHGA